MTEFEEWFESRDLGEDAPKILNEANQSNRYSVEVNYRSTMEEVLENYAKLVLGYVSAAMKNCGFHTKCVFSDKPFRVLVSTRNWDDGEWVGIVTFHASENCFVVAKGSYNKDRKSVSIHSSQKCNAKSAADITRELRNHMEKLKRENPVGSNSLNPAKMKTGPKPMTMKKLKSISGPFQLNKKKS